jgi:hypothetical protein
MVKDQILGQLDVERSQVLVGGLVDPIRLSKRGPRYPADYFLQPYRQNLARVAPWLEEKCLAIQQEAKARGPMTCSRLKLL